MSSKVTLIARTSPLRFDPDISTRSLSAEDIPALGELQFNAYDQGLGEQSVAAATAEMREVFAGKYGNLLTEISQVAVDETGKIIAGVLVVEHAPEAEGPTAPLLIELFTDRDHRRQGLAERLVVISGTCCSTPGTKRSQSPWTTATPRRWRFTSPWISAVGKTTTSRTDRAAGIPAPPTWLNLK